MDEQLANLSDDEHVSEEDKTEKQKPTVPVATPVPTPATTPSVPQANDQEEEESENDDPTSNGGMRLQVLESCLIFYVSCFYS